MSFQHELAMPQTVSILLHETTILFAQIKRSANKRGNDFSCKLHHQFLTIIDQIALYILSAHLFDKFANFIIFNLRKIVYTLLAVFCEIIAQDLCNVGLGELEGLTDAATINRVLFACLPNHLLPKINTQWHDLDEKYLNTIYNQIQYTVKFLEFFSSDHLQIGYYMIIYQNDNVYQARQTSISIIFHDLQYPLTHLFNQFAILPFSNPVQFLLHPHDLPQQFFLHLLQLQQLCFSRLQAIGDILYLFPYTESLQCGLKVIMLPVLLKAS